MKIVRWQAIVVAAAVAAVASHAMAQTGSRAPRIGYVFPAGGQKGTTFTLTLGGQYLDGAGAVAVSGAGVEAKVVQHDKPLTKQQSDKLKEQLKELTDRRAAAQRGGKRGSGEGKPAATWTAEDEKLMAEIRRKLAGFVKKPENPAIAERVVLQVTIAPDAPAGQRELRLNTSLGLTNPMVFQVSSLAEVVEQEQKPVAPPRYSSTKGPAPKAAAAPQETLVTLPAAINGQIMPGDVDRFRFKASKGQRLVIAAAARQLIPYLADAVPGWFQATLALYDAQGRELAYDDDYRFSPDPVLYFEVPEDGEYVVEIKDAIYRGREDFVYRIAIGELPFVTGVFPLGGRAGQPTDVELTGWNLASKSLKLDAGEEGVQRLSLGKRGQAFNDVRLAVGTLPECLEQEPNDADRPQRLALPTVVNGRIERDDDRDVFRFEGRAGQSLVAEVVARRLGSPLDSVLRLTDTSGKQLASNDDCEDKCSGLLTHHADSRLALTLPADGTYLLHLADAQRKGGAEYAYRLRIGPPQPDFELRVVPASLSARAGSSVSVTVYAMRKDGFTGAISLGLKDAPAGFSLGEATVPAGEDQVKLSLRVPNAPLSQPANLQLEGRATIDGRQLVRRVVPAEDMEQAFAYHHLVPFDELRVAVGGRAKSSTTRRK